MEVALIIWTDVMHLDNIIPSEISPNHTKQKFPLWKSVWVTRGVATNTFI